MNASDIFTLIVYNVKQIGEWLESETIKPSDMLAPLGLNSIGRAELIERLMEELKIEANRFEFNAAGNLGELADMFAKKISLKPTSKLMEN